MSICFPSGAFFGLLSRFAVFRRNISTASCGSCKACVKICPTRAISEKNFKATSTAECIMCGKCIGIKQGCSTFVFNALPGHEAITVAPDMGRRQIIAGVAAGTLLLLVLEANALTKRDNTGRLTARRGLFPRPSLARDASPAGSALKCVRPMRFSPARSTTGFPGLPPPSSPHSSAGVK